MMMKIKINNLRVRAIVGTRRKERREPQELLVNVSLSFDGTRAAETDDLADTVNYSDLAERIAAKVEASSFHLLEKLARCVLDAVMAEPAVMEATVEIRKPGALERADSAAVVCTARRER